MVENRRQSALTMVAVLLVAVAAGCFGKDEKPATTTPPVTTTSPRPTTPTSPPPPTDPYANLTSQRAYSNATLSQSAPTASPASFLMLKNWTSVKVSVQIRKVTNGCAAWTNEPPTTAGTGTPPSIVIAKGQKTTKAELSSSADCQANAGLIGTPVESSATPGEYGTWTITAHGLGSNAQLYAIVIMS